jgi:hypothetical protein
MINMDDTIQMIMFMLKNASFPSGALFLDFLASSIHGFYLDPFALFNLTSHVKKTQTSFSVNVFGFGKLRDLWIDHDHFIQPFGLVAGLVAHHETLFDTDLLGEPPTQRLPRHA